MRTVNLNVDCVARVEGDGGIHLEIKDGRVAGLRVNVFEPPRFFEAFLRGRHFSELPDFVARICGICPVPHQTAACLAIEDAFGVAPPSPVPELRRLINCGAWIESHVLHIFMLHAPDYLGIPDALQLNRSDPELLRTALRLKKLGNAIVRAVGGREVHPVNLRPGGFFRLPAADDLRALLPELRWAEDAAESAVEWASRLPFPDFQQDCVYVALHDPDTYALDSGRLVSSGGLDLTASQYEQHFFEEQVAHSHALRSLIVGHVPYLCGPLARFNLNYGQLSDRCRSAARLAGLEPLCHNPFRSIVVRAVELLQALEQARAIIESYAPSPAPSIEIRPRCASGCALVEAPRGLLFHRYGFDEQGLILDARIVPPTSQNQHMMESDLRLFAEQNLSLPRPKLMHACEQVIRNYDPCISCATH